MTVPCPSCIEFNANDPSSPIQDATVKDEASGDLLCEDCYDFYNTDDFNRHIAGDR